MKEYRIVMKPRSSVETKVSSDTLFGALCWAVRVLYNEANLEQLLDQFRNNTPPFLISSAFPFKKIDGSYIFFLPKPIYPFLNTDQFPSLMASGIKPQNKKPYHSAKLEKISIFTKYKTYKKTEYISHILFQGISQAGVKGEELLFKKYLENDWSKPPRTIVKGVQKNSLDRLCYSTAGSGNVFYTSETFFSKDSGMYFLIKTDNFAYIEPLLKYIADSGIGANSRTGKNLFELYWEECDVTLSSAGNSFVTLSRIIADQQIDINHSSYDLVFIRSKVESREEFAGEDIWKNTVAYLKEGSIITSTTPLMGGIVPVKTIHGKTIYQYGFAYPYFGDFSKESNL